jgi:hypothetical protein
MNGTHHVGTLKHQFLHDITKKNGACSLFYYLNNFKLNFKLFFCPCYLLATSTGSKLQLSFSTLAGVGI